MISRREFLQVAAATAALSSLAGTHWPRLAAGQALSQADLLDFEALGNVTLVHLTDLHAQLRPIYFREPSTNIDVGDADGEPPHLTGAAFLERFAVTPGSPEAYALTSEDFVALANAYGRMGGLDRIATAIKAIRAERGAQMLLLDGGDTWQGSYTAQKSAGADMISAMNLLRPDAMTGHWEFTYGAERMGRVIEELPFPFLGGNILDDQWQEPAFPATEFFERGGIKVAVIGQAYPYVPISNPRWLVPNWSFGIRENRLRENVAAARAAGARLVVLLSHNGFDVDRKLASRVDGLDVILSGHTHDALPAPVRVGNTLIVASGSNGKFVSRLDLEVDVSGVKGHHHRLIPIFSDAIAPDPECTALIEELRAPYAGELARVVGKTRSLLYRRGNLNGTFDDLICQALVEQRDAEISLSPGFRWGPSLLPETAITVEDIFNMTAITYPQAYRTEMTGADLKRILEDVADNLFNPDPYYQQGGDMVRVGGMGYRIAPKAPMGKRISGMTLLSSGEPIEAGRSYRVAGWASVNEGTQGPPVWQVVEDHIAAHKEVAVAPNDAVKLVD